MRGHKIAPENFEAKLAEIHEALEGIPEYTSSAYCDDRCKHIDGDIIIPECNDAVICFIVNGIAPFTDIPYEDIYKPDIINQ